MRLFGKEITFGKPAMDARQGEWYYEQDVSGNHWYLNRIGQMIRDGALVLGDQGINRINFDLRNECDKAIASRLCAPLASVIEKCGNMLSNGRLYVTDEKDNELDVHKDIRNLLCRPNPLQDGKTFLKEIERNLKTFGYCPIYAPRGIVGMLPSAMFTVRPEIFRMVWTGEFYGKKKDELISRVCINLGHSEIKPDPSDYFVIYDGEIVFPHNPGECFSVSNIINSLSNPVNNWMAQIIARKNLIVNGGPKGIIYSPTDTTGTGNSVMTTSEKESLQKKFKRKYGLVNKEDQILVTNKNIGWIELSFKTGDLMLHEEDKSCREHISNTIGLNPNVFISDSTYANQNSAKKSAYEDLIIPDAEKIAGALTTALCPDGVFIKLDYSHLSCMQDDMNERAKSLSYVANAVDKLESRGIINMDESRAILAEYIDINPTKNGQNDR